MNATDVPATAGEQAVVGRSDSGASDTTKHDKDEEVDEQGDRKQERVDVAGAKDEYNRLARRLTELSRTATSAHEHDEEKGSEDFDLENFLRSQAAARDEAGFAHRRVGATWRDLEVVGAGGIKLNIRTFPNAIMEFFLSPVFKVMMSMRRFKKPKTRA